MGKDIKDLINDIIDRTDNSYTSTSDTTTKNQTLTFDKGTFREKLSLLVLKDIVSAMMADQTQDLDGMIDKSIIDHIADDYSGSCYNYLCRSRDKTNSPMLGDIIQEIDDATDKMANQITLTKDDSAIDDEIDPLELAKNVDGYAKFRDAIRRKVSEKIINSVAKEIVDSDDAPTFKDTLGKELEVSKKTDEEVPTETPSATPEEIPDETPTENATTPTGESVIIKASTKIISEAYMDGDSISTKDAINKAIIEYCLSEMDTCFLQDTKNNFYNKYIYSR